MSTRGSGYIDYRNFIVKKEEEKIIEKKEEEEIIEKEEEKKPFNKITTKEIVNDEFDLNNPIIENGKHTFYRKLPIKHFIIAFSGKAGVGKDTSALMIKNMFKKENVSLKAFAAPLKQATQILFGLSDHQLSFEKEIPLENGKSPRQILQWFGTDILRKHVDENIFLNLMKKSIENEKCPIIIITDCRFENEAQLIHSLGGKIIKIIGRETTTTHSSHISEQDISYDLLLENNSSLQDLYLSLRNIIISI